MSLRYLKFRSDIIRISEKLMSYPPVLILIIESGGGGDGGGEGGGGRQIFLSFGQIVSSYRNTYIRNEK